MAIYERVLARLRAGNLNLAKVARESGVQYDWLVALSKGKFEDPGVKKMELLDSYFLKLEEESNG